MGATKKTANVTIMIKDSSFKMNGCNGSVFGGGLHLQFGWKGFNMIFNSHFIINNVLFFNNCAEYGGGVYYYSHHDRLHTDDSMNSMFFDNCTFQRNRAHVGSAVAMIPDIFNNTYFTGYLVIPLFQNCQFLNNRVFVKHSTSLGNQLVPGTGTIYASSYDVDFHGLN